MRITAVFGRPRVLRGFHGWMTWIWGIAIPISLLTNLKTSLTWIVLMSAWANFVGHFSSWQAARVEVRIEDAEPDADETVEITEP
jgi:hypothetical protein